MTQNKSFNLFKHKCKCGYNARQCEEDDANFKLYKSESILQCSNKVALSNHVTYPSFQILNRCNSTSELYYTNTKGNIFSPNRHWVFIVEIKQEYDSQFIAETRFGESVMINFSYEAFNDPTSFSWDDLKEGNTLAILYAERNESVFSCKSVNIDNFDFCYVFNSPMSKVYDEAKKLLNEADVTKMKLEHECFNCGIIKANMGHCAMCGLAKYCSKTCQTKAWKSVHRNLCKQSHILLGLSCLPRYMFKKFFSFNKNNMPNYVFDKKFVQNSIKKS